MSGDHLPGIETSTIITNFEIKGYSTIAHIQPDFPRVRMTRHIRQALFHRLKNWFMKSRGKGLKLSQITATGNASNLAESSQFRPYCFNKTVLARGL